MSPSLPCFCHFTSLPQPPRIARLLHGPSLLAARVCGSCSSIPLLAGPRRATTTSFRSSVTAGPGP
eukprot:755828-Hanusia_phi.AAC.1